VIKRLMFVIVIKRLMFVKHGPGRTLELRLAAGKL